MEAVNIRTCGSVSICPCGSYYSEVVGVFVLNIRTCGSESVCPCGSGWYILWIVIALNI